MLYLVRNPTLPLSRFVRILWYARIPQSDHQRQRVLPTGYAEAILNLSRDFLLACPEGQPAKRITPTLMAGPRSVSEIVDTSDLRDLIGVVFAPGALPAFTGDRADLFSNRTVGLGEVCNGRERALRDHLREVSSPWERLRTLEQFLLFHFGPRMEQTRFRVHPCVAAALHGFGQRATVATIAEMAKSTGWSERRFSQIFREQVGFGPKAWCRIQRFQRAVQQLNAGLEIPWAELSVECGFYDQAHFANEFRVFSGIDATTYTAKRSGLWINHVRAD